MQTSSVRATAALAITLSLLPGIVRAQEAAPGGPATPLPFGVSVIGVAQQQDYRVTDLRATAGGFPVPGFDAGVFRFIENEALEVNVKLDWWVLPFLNLHAIAGRVDGEARVGLSPMIAPMLGGATVMDVGYEGWVYGAGATFAVGGERWFGSVTAGYTWGDVDIDRLAGLTADNPRGIGTVVAIPRVGYRTDTLTLWAGGHYQATEHTQKGAFRLGPPMGDIRFEVDLEDAQNWSWLAGMRVELTERWSVSAEAGLGDRRQFMLGIERRF